MDWRARVLLAIQRHFFHPLSRVTKETIVKGNQGNQVMWNSLAVTALSLERPTNTTCFAFCPQRRVSHDLVIFKIALDSQAWSCTTRPYTTLPMWVDWPPRNRRVPHAFGYPGRRIKKMAQNGHLDGHPAPPKRPFCSTLVARGNQITWSSFLPTKKHVLLEQNSKKYIWEDSLKLFSCSSALDKYLPVQWKRHISSSNTRTKKS